MAGQQTSENLRGPDFQRLRQDGVVGVGEDSLGDSPGILPLHTLVVDQDAHQLGDGHGRMGVVELDGDLVRQVFPLMMRPFHEAADDVLDGGRDEKVLLFEAQFAAGITVVGRVKDLGDVLGLCLVLDRSDVLTGVELGQVEFAAGLRSP